ncbi:MAG: transposase, partial [Treponema sp.]|nr:transposase [Treponema sp.]
MGLDMKTKKKICKEIYKRYQRAGKKVKAKILDEYSRTLNYNRDYLARVLSTWGKTRYSVLDGKTVKYIAKEPVKSREKAQGGGKTGRPEKYDETFLEVLKNIW